MTAWSSLPPEVKRNVVNKLDFMSRFGFKTNSYLVMVYTGIEKFLRWEITMCNDINLGMVIKHERFENSFDPKLAVTKMFKIENPEDDFMLLFPFVCTLLGSLLSHEWVRIDAMEFEIMLNMPSFPKTLEDYECTLSCIGSNGDSKFHVKELVYAAQTDEFVKNELHKHIILVGLESIRHLGLIYSDDKMIPVMAHDFYDFTPDDFLFCKETLAMDAERKTSFCLVAHHRILLDAGLRTGRTQMHVIRKPKKRFGFGDPQVDRTEVGTINWITDTKCGKLVQCMFPEHEDLFMQFSDITKCGLGSLCKDCADPFDYWYTQNLPSRVYYEPFWNGVHDKTSELSREHGDNKKLIERFKKNEMEKKKRQKISRLKKERVRKEVASWGFNKNREVSPPIVMGYEPLFTKEPPGVQDPECVESTVTDEPTVNKDPTIIQEQKELQKTGRSPLKYLAILFVFPISMSIIFYLFFMDSELNLNFF